MSLFYGDIKFSTFTQHVAYDVKTLLSKTGIELNFASLPVWAEDATGITFAPTEFVYALKSSMWSQSLSSQLASAS